MVRIFNFLLKKNYEEGFKKIRTHMRSTFLDSLRLTVHGGHGGNGLPKYGGIGGQGGCVYFVAREDLTLKQVALKHSTKRVVASFGEDSSKIRILGRRGLDQRVEVPVGVQIYDEKGKFLGELNNENETLIAAGGGVGGCTGTNFLGKPGEQKVIKLDLKLIADVGLVGFPNAGKSTFLGAISRAKPRIGSYPFTTMRPQIGTVEYPDLRSITIADLPGLIEGAHANFGMGHKFLKHVERTRLLLLIVDVMGFQLGPEYPKRDCLQNLYALNKELELYDNSLLDKPCMLLVNKMDKDGAKAMYDHNVPLMRNLENGLADCPKEIRPERLLNIKRVIPISAKEGKRIDRVKKEIRSLLDEEAESNLEAEQHNFKEALKTRVGERGPKIT